MLPLVPSPKLKNVIFFKIFENSEEFRARQGIRDQGGLTGEGQDQYKICAIRDHAQIFDFSPLIH